MELLSQTKLVSRTIIFLRRILYVSNLLFDIHIFHISRMLYQLEVSKPFTNLNNKLKSNITCIKNSREENNAELSRLLHKLFCGQMDNIS